MAKRFGRNQRRQLRAEVEQWRSAHLITEGLREHQRRKLVEAEIVLEEVRKALGHNFIGLPAQALAVRVMDLSYDDSFRVLGPDDGPVDMTMMRVTSRDNAEFNRVHFKITLDGQQVGYAISRCALYDTPARFLAEKMANEMAPALISLIRKEQGRG